MLQCLADKVLPLADFDIFRNKLLYPVHAERNLFFLVRLLLRHDCLNNFGREFPFLKKTSAYEWSDRVTV